MLLAELHLISILTMYSATVVEHTLSARHCAQAAKKQWTRQAPQEVYNGSYLQLLLAAKKTETPTTLDFSIPPRT